MPKFQVLCRIDARIYVALADDGSHLEHTKVGDF